MLSLESLPEELVEHIFHEALLIDKTMHSDMAIFRTPLSIVQKFATSGADGLVASHRMSESGGADGMDALFALKVAEYRDGVEPKAKAMLDMVWGVWAGAFDAEIAELTLQEMQSITRHGFLWHAYLTETSQQVGTKYRAFVAACTGGPILDWSDVHHHLGWLGLSELEAVHKLQEQLIGAASGAEFATEDPMAIYGGSRPCPPWAFGVRVWPGPTWVSSGMEGQDVVRGPDGVLVRVLGITKAPDKSTLENWSDYVIQACAEGFRPDGGWSPARSLWVEWGSELFRPGQGPSFFYKSGDDGEFDLNYAPQQDPINIAEGVRIMERSFHHWQVMVQEKLEYRRSLVVSLQAVISFSRFELRVKEYMRLAVLEFHAARLAAETFMKQNEDAEPSKIMTTFPSNMISGDAEQEDSD